MEIKYTKSGKGHDVYLDNEWVMWVIGSLKNAKKEGLNYQNNNES